MNNMKIYLVIILLCLLASCTRVYVPYTLQLQEEYNLTDEEVMQLQFYVSDKVMLEREIIDVDKKVSKEHRLKKVEDKLVDQVVFRSLTPGIAVELLPYMLRVAFEDQGYLTFKSEGEPENYYYFKSDRYGDEIKEKVVSYCTWFQRIEDEIFSNGLVTYNVNEYWVFFPETRPHLLVDEESLEKIKEQRRIVKGLRQNK
ncbi:MAG: hypothetical protein RAP70_10760 [Candidatus Celaenobacter antarcticus]|nr:hypothetical protein [Candidatus Celaenobacter antarcticus]